MQKHPPLAILTQDSFQGELLKKILQKEWDALFIHDWRGEWYVLKDWSPKVLVVEGDFSEAPGGDFQDWWDQWQVPIVWIHRSAPPNLWGRPIHSSVTKPYDPFKFIEEIRPLRGEHG